MAVAEHFTQAQKTCVQLLKCTLEDGDHIHMASGGASQADIKIGLNDLLYIGKTMPKYRKKPVVIEAEQFTDFNKDIAYNFVTCNCVAAHDAEGKPILRIQTLEGIMTACLGDWIIKGVNNEFYPCKPDIFEKTYELFDGV